MLTITLLGTAATMPLPDRALSAAGSTRGISTTRFVPNSEMVPAAATACCGTAARARRQRHTGQA